MQDSAHLVDALTTLLQSCGLVQSQESRSQSRRRSFSDGIKVHPGPRKLPLASTLLSQSAIAQLSCSVCAGCGLLGCWPHRQRCRTTAYCSARCLQRGRWESCLASSQRWVRGEGMAELD